MTVQILVSLQDEAQEYHRLQATVAKRAAARAELAIEAVFAENNPVVQIHQLFKAIHAPEGERPARARRPQRRRARASSAWPATR